MWWDLLIARKQIHITQLNYYGKKGWIINYYCVTETFTQQWGPQWPTKLCMCLVICFYVWLFEKCSENLKPWDLVEEMVIGICNYIIGYCLILTGMWLITYLQLKLARLLRSTKVIMKCSSGSNLGATMGILVFCTWWEC